MQSNYRQVAPKHTTRPRKMGKTTIANSQEKGQWRLLVIPYSLTALLAFVGLALVVSQLGAQS